MHHRLITLHGKAEVSLCAECFQRNASWSQEDAEPIVEEELINVNRNVMRVSHNMH
jgi:hypothetical protein